MTLIDFHRKIIADSDMAITVRRVGLYPATDSPVFNDLWKTFAKAYFSMVAHLPELPEDE